MEKLWLIYTTIAATSFTLLLQILPRDTWSRSDQVAIIGFLTAMAITAGFALHARSDVSRLANWKKIAGHRLLEVAALAYVVGWTAIFWQGWILPFAVIGAAALFFFVNQVLVDRRAPISAE